MFEPDTHVLHFDDFYYTKSKETNSRINDESIRESFFVHVDNLTVKDCAKNVKQDCFMNEKKQKVNQKQTIIKLK